MQLGYLEPERIDQLILLLDGGLILPAPGELHHLEDFGRIDPVQPVVQQAVEVLSIELKG